MGTATKQTSRRRVRTRFAVKAAAHGRPRLSVFRSGRHIYAQIIKDEDGVTLAAASSMDEGITKGGNKDAVEEVVFDRGSYLFHGRIKALADAAREAGLSF